MSENLYLCDQCGAYYRGTVHPCRPSAPIMNSGAGSLCYTCQQCGSPGTYGKVHFCSVGAIGGTGGPGEAGHLLCSIHGWTPTARDIFTNKEDCMKCAQQKDFSSLKEKVDLAVGVKHDEQKVRLDLLSSIWITGVGDVLTFGAKKYEAHNWRKGLLLSRLLGACLRHIFAFNAGEDKDAESGLNHLYHASCCLMFASELLQTKPEMDDRYKGEKK